MANLVSRSREQQATPWCVAWFPAGVQKARRRPQVTKGQGKYYRSPATRPGMSAAVMQPFCGARRHRPTAGQNGSRRAAQSSRLFAALRGQPARARCRPALHTKGPEGTTARQRRSERTRQIHQPQGGRHPDQLAESSHPKGKRGPSGITSAAPLKPNGGLPPWKPTGTPLPEGDPHGYKTQRLPTQTHRP